MTLFLALALLTYIKAHFVTAFGVAGRGKATHKLLALVISYSGNPYVRHDTVFSLGPFNINKTQFIAYICCYPFWGCWQG